MILRRKDSVPKMYSFFHLLYCFLNIYIRGPQNLYSFGKPVHFGTNIIVNEIKSQGQCTKDVQLFSLVVQLFNSCTAFEKYIYEDHRICTALEKAFFYISSIQFV